MQVMLHKSVYFHSNETSRNRTSHALVCVTGAQHVKRIRIHMKRIQIHIKRIRIHMKRIRIHVKMIRINVKRIRIRLQTTQPTSGRATRAVTNCSVRSANSVDRPKTTTDTTQGHRLSSKSERNLIILYVNINGINNKLEELIL